MNTHISLHISTVTSLHRVRNDVYVISTICNEIVSDTSSDCAFLQADHGIHRLHTGMWFTTFSQLTALYV